MSLESLPERIEEKRDWDKQTNLPTLKVRGQGFKTRIERLDKPVNHGLWKQYRIEPVDPKTRLTLAIESLRALPDGGFAFDLAQYPDIRFQLGRGDQAMLFINLLVFLDTAQELNRGVIISQFVMQRAQRKKQQRRRIGHCIQHALTGMQDFLHLKTEPALFIVTQHFVGSQVKFKDTADLISLRL